MIRHTLTVLATALFFVFLQATIFGTFFPRWMIPNLCLVIVLYLGVYQSTALGALLAFLVGILLDLSSGQLLGPWGAAFVAIFGLLSQGGKKLFIDSSLTVVAVTFVAAIVGQVIYLLLLSQFAFSWRDFFSSSMFGAAISTALIAPACFAILRSGLLRKPSVGKSRYTQQRLF